MNFRMVFVFVYGICAIFGFVICWELYREGGLEIKRHMAVSWAAACFMVLTFWEIDRWLKKKK